MEAKLLAQMAADAAEEKKAAEVSILAVGELTPVCDYFVIAAGNSTIQVKAIAENVAEALEKAGVGRPRKEGFREGRWVLLDYGSVVVHVFHEKERTYYSLERLWGDAPALIREGRARAAEAVDQHRVGGNHMDDNRA